MTCALPGTLGSAVPTGSAWSGFTAGRWADHVDVRDFIQRNYTPYRGDGSFLAGPTARTTHVWDTVSAMFPEERAKGVYDVDPHTPAGITAHAPGYIDRDAELIVGLQTDAPLKRAIMPNGGFRLVVNALKAFGYEPDPQVVETFTKYRTTHNDAAFDAYTADVRRCRSSHILTGLPDAYGRGRIIGDYRRVALYGVNRLIERKQEEKRNLDNVPWTDDIIRDREEPSEQIRALMELLQMAKSYGFEHLGPGAHGQGGGAVALFRVPGWREGAERRRHVAGADVDVSRHLLRARSRVRDAHRGTGPGDRRTTS